MQFGQLAELIVTGRTKSSARGADYGSESGFLIKLPKPGEVIRQTDETNEWLKKNTYLDALGWRDVVMNTILSARQIRVLGFTGVAFVKETKAGRMIVLRAPEGLGQKLIEIGFIEANPVLAQAGFKFTPEEFKADAAKAVAIGIICLVAWDIVHECLQDHFDTVRLGVTIVSDVLKSIAAAGLGVLAAAFIPVGTPVVVAFIAVAVIGTVASIGFEALDREFGVTEKLQLFAHQADRSISGRIYKFLRGADEQVRAICYKDMLYLVDSARID